MTTTPGAVPRGCYTCYRGNLAAEPRKIQRESNNFATARMGVNIASPDVPAEMRDKLTEWVTVMAFSEANQTKLLKCKKGELIMVMGNVTRKPYQTQAGEERIDRTIIVDSMMAASASATDTAGGGAEDAPDPNAPPTPARRQRTRLGSSGRVPLPPAQRSARRRPDEGQVHVLVDDVLIETVLQQVAVPKDNLVRTQDPARHRTPRSRLRTRSTSGDRHTVVRDTRGRREPAGPCRCRQPR